VSAAARLKENKHGCRFCTDARNSRGASPGREKLPFVEYQEGVVFQFLQADVATGLWVIRVRFQPGVTIQRHRHTGEVFAFTIRGSWNYVEYPELNTAGSYLFEPAGSIHTLYVPGSNKEVTDVWFAIRGANLNLDEAGNVVLDAGAVLEIYRARCEKSGLAHPDVIGAQAVRATVWNKVKGATLFSTAVPRLMSRRRVGSRPIAKILHPRMCGKPHSGSIPPKPSETAMTHNPKVSRAVAYARPCLPAS